MTRYVPLNHIDLNPHILYDGKVCKIWGVFCAPNVWSTSAIIELNTMQYRLYEELDKMLLSWWWLTHPLVWFLFPKECTRKIFTSGLSSAGVIQNRAYVICYVKRPLPSLRYDTTRPIKLALLSCVVFSFVVVILTWTMPVTTLS